MCGQDSEMFGAGEEPLVAASMTRSVLLTSQLSMAMPVLIKWMGELLYFGRLSENLYKIQGEIGRAHV